MGLHKSYEIENERQIKRLLPSFAILEPISMVLKERNEKRNCAYQSFTHFTTNCLSIQRLCTWKCATAGGKNQICILDRYMCTFLLIPDIYTDHIICRQTQTHPHTYARKYKLKNIQTKRLFFPTAEKKYTNWSLQ